MSDYRLTREETETVIRTSAAEREWDFWTIDPKFVRRLQKLGYPLKKDHQGGLELPGSPGPDRHSTAGEAPRDGRRPSQEPGKGARTLSGERNLRSKRAGHGSGRGSGW